MSTPSARSFPSVDATEADSPRKALLFPPALDAEAWGSWSDNKITSDDLPFLCSHLNSMLFHVRENEWSNACGQTPGGSSSTLQSFARNALHGHYTVRNDRHMLVCGTSECLHLAEHHHRTWPCLSSTQTCVPQWFITSSSWRYMDGIVCCTVVVSKQIHWPIHSENKNQWNKNPHSCYLLWQLSRGVVIGVALCSRCCSNYYMKFQVALIWTWIKPVNVILNWVTQAGDNSAVHHPHWIHCSGCVYSCICSQRIF